jgi:non-ribosomal peptide synthetase component F
MFAPQHAPRQALELSGLTLNRMEVDCRTAKFDLILFMVEEPEGLKTSLEYSTDLFDAATIVRMLRHFQTLLERIIADPQQRLADLPLLTEVERRQLLGAWKETRVEYPSGSCLHELFDAQGERTLDSTAVVFGDQHLTYSELNHRANQLAHYLRKREVGPDVLVGICVERSVEMVVGLLGILKAGAAYVPLDPT